MSNWTPTAPEDWTRAFGLVAVPYFGRYRTELPRGTHLMMQDGEAASFALHITPPDALLTSRQPLGWAWSSHVRHAVVFDAATKVALVRRWDDPAFSEHRTIATERDAGKLIDDIERSIANPSAQDVIERTLNTFSLLRTAIEERGGSSLDVVVAFNAALLLAEMWRESPKQLIPAELAETVTRLHRAGRPGFGGVDISEGVRSYPIGEFARILLEEKQDESPYLLDADLLIRHASGRLYQEAHRRLAKPPPPTIRQRVLFDDALPSGSGGRREPAPRFVHHTPPWLARAMVEVAIEHSKEPGAGPLEVLDPACGSGVFLIETVRELERFSGGTVRLRGMDLSEEAGTMTEFCVGEASRDLTKVTVSQLILRGIDSLSDTTNWGQPDIILMNPPFKAWRDLDDLARATVRQVLGSRMAGRPDLYLAFLARAATALRPGGVLASVVPSAFFSTKSAAKVRALLNGGDFRVRMVGLFRGFETFDKALVEAAVLVVAKSKTEKPVRTVIAEKGYAEKAVRLLRTLSANETAGSNGVEISTISSDSLKKEGWVLHRRRDLKFAEKLRSSTVTRVRDLFTVRLGIRGIGARGHTKVLLLTDDNFHRFAPTTAEKQFFRPVADTIERGRIKPSGYVFYPYDSDGRLLLATEEELAAVVPIFYREVLLPAKDALLARRSLNRGRRGGPNRNWWEPSEPVKTWLAARTPRIVSQEFGGKGSFAFDEEGRYAVVGGNAWCWKNGEPQTDTMFRYLALINSRIFERLLRAYCPRLQGGQFRLESRFVHEMPLPDLTSVDGQLTEIGRLIHVGESYDDDLLDETVLAAYGLKRNPAELERRFRALADRWEKETGMLSSVTKMLKHPAYLAIVKMGESQPQEMLRLILRELQARLDYWFAALKAIAKETPVKPEERADPKRVREAWLKWGREKHLIG